MRSIYRLAAAVSGHLKIPKGSCLRVYCFDGPLYLCYFDFRVALMSVTKSPDFTKTSNLRVLNAYVGGILFLFQNHGST